MAERDDIKLEALHIYGEAINWWFPAMNTLVHDQVVTYEECTLILAKRFDGRDTDISFHELAHIRQVGTPESYTKEFEKVAVMVSDISEARPLLLFT